MLGGVNGLPEGPSSLHMWRQLALQAGVYVPEVLLQLLPLDRLGCCMLLPLAHPSSAEWHGVLQPSESDMHQSWTSIRAVACMHQHGM